MHNVHPSNFFLQYFFNLINIMRIINTVINFNQALLYQMKAFFFIFVCCKFLYQKICHIFHLLVISFFLLYLLIYICIILSANLIYFLQYQHLTNSDRAQNEYNILDFHCQCSIIKNLFNQIAFWLILI